MNKSKRWLYVLFTVVLLTGCYNRNTLYHHYEHTCLDGWDKSDTLTFDVPRASCRMVVQRELDLRTTSRYPYRDISVVVEQTVFPAHYFRRDTLHCNLADAEGRSEGSGLNLLNYSFRLPDISLNEGDSLHFSVRHVMRREILPGIADVGIHLSAY